MHNHMPATSIADDFPIASIPHWVLDNKFITPNAICVYLKLSRFIDRDGRCTPTLKQLAKASALDMHDLKVALDILENYVGAIEHLERRGSSSAYFVHNRFAPVSNLVIREQ